eukprot:6133437-Lingulodinium_polyedra.AAC.1
MTAANLATLQQCSRDIWAGWGQTKLIEDGNREIRQQESFDTNNLTLSIAKQWDSLATRGVVGQHGRAEVDLEQATARANVEAAKEECKGLFSAKFHQPTVDAQSLTTKRAWPSYTPQTSVGPIAAIALLQHCYELDRWNEASNCWLSARLPSGTV